MSSLLLFLFAVSVIAICGGVGGIGGGSGGAGAGGGVLLLVVVARAVLF